MAKSNLRIGILMMMFASERHQQIYGVSKNYIKFAKQWGTPVIVSPDQNPEDMKIDLLILPGGPDLSLELQNLDAFPYGQGKDQPTYTYFYGNTIDKWIDAKIPMFGICLGSQALANEFGATLTHDGHGHQLRDEHRALQIANKQLEIKTAFHDVNSRHHQFINVTDWPEDQLEIVSYGAYHEEDLLVPKGTSFAKHAEKLAYSMGETSGAKFFPSHVEAFIHKSLPIAGVQWHPEDMLYGTRTHGDSLSRLIVDWLLTDRSKSRLANQEPNAATLSA